MSRPNLLVHNYIFARRSRRDLCTSSPRWTSTSPQRQLTPAQAPTSCAKPFNDIPGPLALPMLRHSYHVLPRIGCFHHTVGLGLLEKLRDRYGDLVRVAKGSRKRAVLYVFNPDTMQEVYDNEFVDPPLWEMSPVRVHRKQLENQCPIRGDEKKAIWAAIRALLQDRTLLENYDKAFDDIAIDTTERLAALSNTSNALNEELVTEMYRWAIEIVGITLFGSRLGCLEGATHVPSSNDGTPEKTSMDDHIKELCSLSKRPFIQLTPPEQMVRISKEIADENYLVRNENTLKTDSEFFQKIIQILEAHFRLTQSFLSKSLDDLQKNYLRPEQVLLDKLKPLESRILPLAADAFLAGIDPLAQTAVSMLYQLSLHAAQQQRAHDETAWAAAAAECVMNPTYTELPYLTACAREVLRLHPATGGVLRRSRESISVGGYEIPAGVDIVLAHGVTSKSEKNWGRAKAFVPERWTESWSPLRASKVHPLASLPFGVSCPATGVITKMLSSLATRVLEKYRLEWHGPPPNMVTTGVNKLQPPFYFVLQKAA